MKFSLSPLLFISKNERIVLKSDGQLTVKLLAMDSNIMCQNNRLHSLCERFRTEAADSLVRPVH